MLIRRVSGVTLPDTFSSARLIFQPRGVHFHELIIYQCSTKSDSLIVIVGIVPYSCMHGEKNMESGMFGSLRIGPGAISGLSMCLCPLDPMDLLIMTRGH